MAGKQIRSKLLPRDKDPDYPPKFLPLGDLESIMSEGAVDEIIVDALGITEANAIEIRKQICGNRSEPRRIKILATLILIEKVKHIQGFLKHDVWDDELPLPFDVDHAVFQDWKEGYVDSFCYRQYVVLAPVFDFTTMKHKKFGLSLPMPFLERLAWELGGAHGKISKVRIHQDHHSWDRDSVRRLIIERCTGTHTVQASEHDPPCFAVKRFQEHSKFKQERQALERFSLPNRGHDHLVRLLLSYERGGEFFMIFPWAQCNLVDFWRKSPSNPKSRDDTCWFIQQCRGMASGLRKVHNDGSWPPRCDSRGDTSQFDFRNRGRHGDIKPENILFFPKVETTPARLVIADFTLMRFHSVDTVDYTTASGVGFTGAYCPPELEPGSHSIVSQKYDIWTLGCVYLEFITWHLIGYDAIREDSFKSRTGKLLESFDIVRLNDHKKHGFSTNTFFNQTNGSGAQVKTSVWIRMLHKNPYCSEAMDHFLNLIEEHMLVPMPEGRYSMDQVCTELTKISLRCQSDDGYCYVDSVDDPGCPSKDDEFPPEFTNEQASHNDPFYL
ncbi:hypothetical protein Neosp_003203 [[Neocosmospora] mangrovei]